MGGEAHEECDGEPEPEGVAAGSGVVQRWDGWDLNPSDSDSDSSDESDDWRGPSGSVCIR